MSVLQKENVMTLTIQEVQSQLPNLIHDLRVGSEVEITENGMTVAKLTVTPVPRQAPKLGTQRGSVISMEHFNDPLDDFAEYM